MRVVDRLAEREAIWRELDDLLRRLDNPRLPPLRRKPKPADVIWLDGEGRDVTPKREAPKSRAEEIIRLGELYRAACADLMLAEAHDLPRDTVAYLHSLVARAHNAVYRAQGFRFTRWAGELLHAVPRRLRTDPALWISAFIFYGTFLFFGLIGATLPDSARKIVGQSALDSFEQMYSAPLDSHEDRSETIATGFYIQHNAGIGLQCFAWGMALGLGTLYILVSNGVEIGVVFGHMLTTPMAANFYTFVTAHAPFELTAIVFSGAAGLRLGWGLIDTKGQTRLASLRREAARALPTMGASVFLFILAAFLEGCVSASPLPYAFKAGIALTCAALLVAYLTLGGRERASVRRMAEGG